MSSYIVCHSVVCVGPVCGHSPPQAHPRPFQLVASSSNAIAQEEGAKGAGKLC